MVQDQTIIFDRDALQKAAHVLSGAAFRLYAVVALLATEDKMVVLPLSMVDIFGLSMSPNMAMRARQELVDLGFLTLVSAPCTYRFCPLGADDAAEKAAAKRMKKAARLRKKEGGTVEKRAPARDVEAWELVDF